MEDGRDAGRFANQSNLKETGRCPCYLENKILLGSPQARHPLELRAAHFLFLFHPLLLTPALPGFKRLQMTLTISWSARDWGRCGRITALWSGLRAGKELPDTRQNEREINFTRVGDTVKQWVGSRVSQQLNGGPCPFIPGVCKEWD